MSDEHEESVMDESMHDASALDDVPETADVESHDDDNNNNEEIVEPEETQQTEETAEHDDDDDDVHNDEESDQDADEDFVEGDKDPLDDSQIAKLKPSKRSNAPSIPKTTTTTTMRREKSVEQMDRDDNDEREMLDESAKRRQELEAKLERALKRPKIKRRKDEDDLTNDDDAKVQILKQQMDSAAKLDADIIENKTENDNVNSIAIHKIQLLPKVRNVLSKANLAEIILDNNLLAEVRQWLEPLPDASLPSYEIQKTMFSAMLKLPINTNHLRESGIGKILLFYQKSKRVEPQIKRMADKLISDWTRPIIGASDNYRDKHFQSKDFDPVQSKKRSQKVAKSQPKMTAEQQKERERKRLAAMSIYEQQAARRNRAAAPPPTVTDYKIAPKSRVTGNENMKISSAGVGSSLNRDDQFKRIKQRLSGNKRSGGAKKGGISIEGRGMQ